MRCSTEVQELRYIVYPVIGFGKVGQPICNAFGRLFILIFDCSFRLKVGIVWPWLFDSLGHPHFSILFCFRSRLKVGQGWLGGQCLFLLVLVYVCLPVHGLPCIMYLFIGLLCTLAHYGLTCELYFLYC